MTKWKKLIKSGDISAIQNLIDKNENINEPDEDGFTPLMIAAEGQNPEIVNMLINAGADVNARYKYGETPLMFALGWGKNQDVIKALIDGGADVNAENKKGKTPLMIATECNIDEKIINILTEAGAEEKPFHEEDDDVRNITQAEFETYNVSSPSFFSFFFRHGVTAMIPFWIGYFIVCSVLYYDADVNALNKQIIEGNYVRSFNMTILSRIRKYYKNFSYSPKINEIGSNGLTPLVTAVSYPSENTDRIVSLLIGAGADPTVTGKGKVSPLIATLAKKSPAKLIKKLIKRGANVNERMAKNLTPLLVAVKKDADISVIETLLKEKADPNVISREKENPLALAIQKDNAELVGLLLKYKADPFFPIEKTKDVMDIAIQNASVKTAKEIIRHTDKEKIKQYAINALKAKKSSVALSEFLKPIITSQKEADELYLLSAEAGNARAMAHLKTLNANILGMKDGKTALEILTAKKNVKKDALKTVREFTEKANSLVKAIAFNDIETVEKTIAEYLNAKDESFKAIKVKNEFNLMEAGVIAKMDIPMYSLLQKHGLAVQKDDPAHFKKILSSVLKNNPNVSILNMFVENTTDDLFDFDMVSLALKNPNPEVFIRLLELKPSLREQKDKKNKSLLSLVFQNGKPEQIEFLISSVESIENDQSFTLKDALKKKLSSAAIKKLLESGFDVNQEDQQKETPLMAAVLNGCDQGIVTLLLENKANPDLENKKGKNAYELSVQTKSCTDDVRTYLKSVTTPKVLSAKPKKAAKKQTKNKGSVK